MNRSARELGRYVLVGVCVAVGYLAVAAGLHHAFGWGLQACNAVAILSMHPFSYLGHRFVTFEYAGPWTRTIGRFAVVAALSTTVSVGVSSVQSVLGIPVLVALLANCVAVPSITFLALKFWVFNRSPSRAPPRREHTFDLQ